MSLPSTPRKSGHAINNIVSRLNNGWGLQIPIRTVAESPSKRSSRKGLKESIYDRIGFLYWQDHELLEQALDDFCQHAGTILTHWKFKPCADIDVLPATSRADAQGILLDGLDRDLSPAEVALLNQALYRFLFPPRQANTRSFGIVSPRQGNNDVARSFSHGTRARLLDVEIPPSKYVNIKTFFKKPAGVLPDSVSSAALKQASEIVHGESAQDLLQELEVSGVPDLQAISSAEADSLQQIDQPSDNETFVTPPETRDGQDMQNDDTAREQMAEHLVQTLTVINRKRSFLDTGTASTARKTSRGNDACYRPGQDYVYRPESRLLRSFDSVSTSCSAYDASNIVTPNTSFGIESACTSFGSRLGFGNLQLGQDIVKSTTSGSKAGLLDAQTEKMDLDIGAALTGRVDYPKLKEMSSVDNGHNLPITGFIADHLKEAGPFTKGRSPLPEKLSFREAYEVTRVALHCGLDAQELSRHVRKSGDQYRDLWSALSVAVGRYQKAMPERSGAAVWDKATDRFDGVSLTGELNFGSKAEGSLFDFRLAPLKFDASYRLGRKFGADRFFVLGVPGLEKSDIPPSLRDKFQVSVPPLKDQVISWLVETEHHLLGRVWRAFFVKPHKSGAKPVKDSSAQPAKILYRVYMFAVDGTGFRSSLATGERQHIAMSVEALLKWFMPMENNSFQAVLKLFSRLALGVSSTRATVSFRPYQVVRTRDAFSNSPGKRLLRINRNTKKTSRDGHVMNDGCARISLAAARAVAADLHLNYVPSAFQCRIGGAKGVWMVDALDERIDALIHTNDKACKGSDTGDFWIEIADSQLKFEGHDTDVGRWPDEDRLTLEVHSYTGPLKPNFLNFQLIPILLDRGVPLSVFREALVEDLSRKTSQLLAGMSSGRDLRAWTQINLPVSRQRATAERIDWAGALPDSEAEQINWMCESGFAPKTCSYLKDLCCNAITRYCLQHEERMHIGISRSTFVMMIADPLAILEEDEVHLGFSTAFQDPQLQFQETLLHDIEVLVARVPAHLPSDIQKVKAVFKPELAIYKDVIIFPSKGACSLAEKLSGGDYDGDRAWVCWEPALVEHFENAEVREPPPKAYYGLAVDSEKVGDILKCENPVSRFLHKGFYFNMQPSILGICTVYHDALCYVQNAINSGIAQDIAVLLGYLVDSAKGGFTFTEAHWQSFLQEKGLPKKLQKPAYKDRSNGKPPKSNHIIDVLVFDVARPEREKQLASFLQTVGDVPDYDADLATVWRTERAEATANPSLNAILRDLESQLEALRVFWLTNCSSSFQGPETRQTAKMSFKGLVENARHIFLAIKPLENSDYYMAHRWGKEMTSSDNSSTDGSWLRLKASALFAKYCKQKAFVWHVCGKELGALKANTIGAMTVVNDIHTVLKVDMKMVRRIQEKEHGNEEDIADCEWNTQDFEDGFGDIAELE